VELVADLLAWLEGSALGLAMRGFGVWTYGLVNLVHILGVASLFGSALLIDLRLLGAFRRVPIGVLAGPTVALATTGFVVAAASGVCMLAANATEYVANPFLLVKFAAIIVGLLNAALLFALPAWRNRRLREPTAPERWQLAIAGGISLVSWLTAVGAGRMIGYW
jgi:hypothetical protein